LLFPTEATEAFGGMYTTGPAAGVLKTILALTIMFIPSKVEIISI
jgi:hypothetical protein